MKRLIGLSIALLLVFSACSSGDAPVIQARFDDVSDLFPQAPVTFADIRVGTVTKIELDGTQALITMELYEDADVPANVSARARRTSVLGERIIDLFVPEGVSESSGALADGATIAETETRADLENLVVEGNDVLGALGASEIATMVDEGARAFGGRGNDLKTIIFNFRDITKTFNKNSGSIKSLIRNIDDFNQVVASKSAEHEDALVNTARALEVLDQESDELTAAIASLARLATGSRSLLQAHIDEMDNFFQQARTIVGALRNEQGSILKILTYAPLHNRNTQLVEFIDFNQVIQEFVICGFNDNPDDPARRCTGKDEG